MKKGRDEGSPALDICGKIYPLTCTVQNVVQSLSSMLEGYGDHVQESSGKGVDYKALSHALRVAEEAMEVVQTGGLVFPRPNAAYLLEVKKGNCDPNEILETFEKFFIELEESVKTSKLPERTKELEKEFKEWKLDLLRAVYKL